MRLRRKRDSSPQPICGCKHHLSFHDPKTGRCNHTDQLRVSEEEPVRDASGEVVRSNYGQVVMVDVNRYHEVRCGCMRYIGAEPLTEYYASEISPEIRSEII